MRPPARYGEWIMRLINPEVDAMSGRIFSGKKVALLMMAAVIPAILSTLAGCGRQQQDHADWEDIPNVVTADIQAGIEQHIEEQERLGDGYFRIQFQDETLELKLVRVHTEYLATLGPRRHFACVDLVDTSGDVYDVDFFLSGDPGEMVVTDTKVHKLNGRPFYAWRQRKDGTWETVPVQEASEDLLGVVTGRDSFEFIYQIKLPDISESARLWMPLASSDRFQTIKSRSISGPGEKRTLTDPEYGNRALFFQLGPADSGKVIEARYEVERFEKSPFEDPGADPSKFLKPERLVPEAEIFDETAAEIVDGVEGDLAKARALYDHVINHMNYMKYGSGWGVGDAMYACDSASGNCSDFHSYFIALARAAGIPARFAVGASIPSERNEGRISGYHCWAEFYADGKWWPVDISEANKYTDLADYHFGRHSANRFELSRGRDLVLEPGPDSGPINFLAYPVLELDGRETKAHVVFSFRRISEGQ